MKIALLILLAPLFSLAQATQGRSLNLDLSGLVDQPTSTTTTTTVTTTSTTVAVTTTTLPAKPAVVAPVAPTLAIYNFSSPLLNKIMHGQAPASDLPFWYGFRWNRKIHPVIDDWTEFLYKEIDANGKDLTAGGAENIDKFCPRYHSLNPDERILFWVKLVTVLMSFESGYEPDKFYDDTKNVPGAVGKVISSGLLMMSHDSVMPSAYGCTMINVNREIGSKDLFDPKKNMACAIHIMNYWVKTDGVMADRSENSAGETVWKGLARYWGPFRHLMLKKDEDGLWSELLGRVPLWTAENELRDSYLLNAVTTAIKDNVMDKKVWEASACRAPHPSMLDEKYEKKESHRFTSIVRLMNQTSFCYK